MLAFLGLSSAPPEMLIFTAAFAFALALAFGWATDLALREAGFGLVGNALLAIAGAILGGHFLAGRMGLITGMAAPWSPLLAGAVVAMLCLCGATVLKKAVASG